MDNKGQTLVTFVLILPIILLILLCVIDYGLVSIQKHEATSSIKDSITYALKNSNSDNIEEKMKNLIYKNIDENKIKSLDISINNQTVSIKMNYKPNKIFNFININSNIELSYVGNYDNNQIRIEKR